jgi:hypothetical protein
VVLKINGRIMIPARFQKWGSASQGQLFCGRVLRCEGGFTGCGTMLDRDVSMPSIYLSQALPAKTVADLARILYEEGTERPEMERMLAADHFNGGGSIT